MFDLIQLLIAMTLLIYPFDEVYAHIPLEIFISMLLALQVVAIEVLVVVVVNVAVAVVCTYCFLVI